MVLKAGRSGFEGAVLKMVEMAVDEVEDGFTVGLGSGSTAAKFVSELAERVRKDGLEVYVIPSSLQIQLAAEEVGLNISHFKPNTEIDVTVDGADQIGEDFSMIKGGGGALYRERILLNAARRAVILAEGSKFVRRLFKPVPIETSFFARGFVYKELVRLEGRPRLRLVDKGYPFITENGNLIFDTDFGVIEDPRRLRMEIADVAGVIEVGVFVDEGDVFYKACGDGSVERLEAR